MNKRYHLTGALICAALIIVLAGGCKPKTAAAPEAGTAKKLVFATTENTDPNYSYKNKLPVWAELERRTGIEIEFEVSPGGDYNSIMSVRLAAGVNLPDIVRLPGGNPLQFVTNGLIIPLNDLIVQYGPNITALFNKRPDVRKVLTAPDGKIYTLAAIVDARSQVNFGHYGVRKDWLEKLGLPEPDTIDDWYNMLKAFKTRDPNGNGKADEIPITGTRGTSSVSGAYTTGLFKFASSYGLHLDVSDGWHAGDDGKVQYEWIDPRMKDYLAEMHKWYADGLIDPEFTTQSGDQYTAKAIGNIAGADFASFTMQYPQWNIRMRTEIPEARWESTVPAAGPGGIRFLERENPTENTHFAITRDCKDPAAALKWLDYMYASPEGQILMCNFGIEGLTYNMVDGKPMLSDLILKYERGSGLGMEIHGMNSGSFPRVLMAEMIEQRFMQYTEQVEASRKAVQYYVAPFPVIMATDAETTELASLLTDINTLRNEYILDFITGRKDLAQFDRFVSQVKSMGIDRVVAIKQGQYDRYQAAK